MEYVSPEGLRLDGRRAKELRQVRCELGILDSADGSASFEVGNTKVIAVVYGPHEVTRRAETLHDRALVQCEYGMASFSSARKQKRGKGDRRSVELSLIIRQTMEAAIRVDLLPRTQIDIFVQVLQADGGVKGACINAASLALCHAGVPMHDLVASCAAGFLNSTPILDMNRTEEGGGGPDLTVGYLPAAEKATLVQMDSKLQMDDLERVFNLSITGCRAIAVRMKEVLLEHTERLALARGAMQL